MPCICSDRVTAFNDAVLNVGIIPQIHIIQYNGILDHAVVSREYLLKDDGILYRSVDNTSAPHKAVLDNSARIIFCRR